MKYTPFCFIILFSLTVILVFSFQTVANDQLDMSQALNGVNDAGSNEIAECQGLRRTNIISNLIVILEILFFVFIVYYGWIAGLR